MAKFKMTGGATFWYYLINIFSFASLYFIKIAVMKAFVDINASRD
jgi:hypothetical protein